MATRSLLDDVDVGRLRAGLPEAPGSGRAALDTVLACLSAPGVLHHDPADPSWEDRDRLLVDAALDVPVPPGLAERVEDEVLAVAVGAAAASALGGSLSTVVAVVDERGLRSGASWEAAQTAVGARLRELVVAGPLGAGAELLAAAGFLVVDAAGGDALEVLWALDRCWRADRPSAVHLR